MIAENDKKKINPISSSDIKNRVYIWVGGEIHLESAERYISRVWRDTSRELGEIHLAAPKSTSPSKMTHYRFPLYLHNSILVQTQCITQSQSHFSFLTFNYFDIFIEIKTRNEIVKKKGGREKNKS